MFKGRADFVVVPFLGAPGCVFIVDLDEKYGGTSVTNDAEAVVEYIHTVVPGARVIYRDTIGEWDELAHRDGEFTGYVHYDGPVPEVY